MYSLLLFSGCVCILSPWPMIYPCIHPSTNHHQHSRVESFQQQRRMQSRNELASRVGAITLGNGPIYAVPHAKSTVSYGSHNQVHSQTMSAKSASPSVDSGYRSPSYQTLTPSLSTVSPVERSGDVTTYIGKDGSETRIRNVTERKNQTVQMNPGRWGLMGVTVIQPSLSCSGKERLKRRSPLEEILNNQPLISQLIRTRRWTWCLDWRVGKKCLLPVQMCRGNRWEHCQLG